MEPCLCGDTHCTRCFPRGGGPCECPECVGEREDADATLAGDPDFVTFVDARAAAAVAHAMATEQPRPPRVPTLTGATRERAYPVPDVGSARRWSPESATVRCAS
jgi:hypothetical protein